MASTAESSSAAIGRSETATFAKLRKVCDEMGWCPYVRFQAFRQDLMVTVSIEHWVVRRSETKERRHVTGSMYLETVKHHDYHTIATKTRLFPSTVIAGNIALFNSDLAVDTLVLELFAQIGLSF